MISANKAFKSQIRKVNYADITMRDGTVLNLEPSDFILGGFSMLDETTTGKFGIGSTVGKTISLSIANYTNKFSLYDFYKAIVNVYVSITLEDGTVLKESKGKYYVINPTSPGDVINISGVDSMYLFDKPYNASTAYPATLQSILSDCCLDCGVNIGFGQFNNYNFVIENKPTDCTYRQVVSWVSQIAGYNARISNNDYLELVWFDTSLVEDILSGGKFISYDEEDIYSGGDFTTYTNEILFDGGNFTDPSPENITKIKSIKVSTDDVVITGVKVKNGEVEAQTGEEGYCITLSENPLVEGKESEIAEYLGNKLIGLRFRPLSCEIANNPLIEPFDICYVYDRKGNYYLTFINSVNYSISGFTTIACKAEDPIRNESSYVSKEAQAVVKAKKEAAKQLSTYDKAVQNMNMLAANAMGLYRESEEKIDGSVIYYQSNRPIYKNENGVCEFVTNSVVYKMTGDGFFVSTDGGLSYTSGFDAQGNAVVNVLSAIGITFDWAKGGTLTLGGADNVNGSLYVYDENGNYAGRWDNKGIYLDSGNGIEFATLQGGILALYSKFGSTQIGGAGITQGFKHDGVTTLLSSYFFHKSYLFTMFGKGTAVLELDDYLKPTSYYTVVVLKKTYTSVYAEDYSFISKADYTYSMSYSDNKITFKYDIETTRIRNDTSSDGTLSISKSSEGYIEVEVLVFT